MAKKKKAAIFARELPIYPGNEVLGFYYQEKWARFTDLLNRGDVELLMVTCPEILGDDYLELIVNLSKVADAGVKLAIDQPSRTIRKLGEVNTS